MLNGLGPLLLRLYSLNISPINTFLTYTGIQQSEMSGHMDNYSAYDFHLKVDAPRLFVSEEDIISIKAIRVRDQETTGRLLN